MRRRETSGQRWRRIGGLIVSSVLHFSPPPRRPAVTLDGSPAFALSLELQIDDAIDSCQRCGDLVADPVELVEIVAEDLDRDLRRLAYSDSPMRSPGERHDSLWIPGYCSRMPRSSSCAADWSTAASGLSST